MVRWDTLPENLRDAIFSEQNADILWKFCEAQHLSDDKIYKIATITGNVIMGFIHPEDLVKEITDELQINSQISAAVSAEVDKKIFAPIREELKKVYAPAPAANWGENVIDLKAPPAPVSIPQPVSLSSGIDSSKSEMLKNFAPQGEPMPLADAGPMILHEEAKLKPAVGNTSRSLGGLFGFGKKTELPGNIPGAAAQVKFGGENLSVPAPSQRAPMNSAEQTPRIVHYTEFRTPISPVGGVESDPAKDGPVSLSSIAQPVAPKPISQGPNVFSGIFNPSSLPKPPLPPRPPAPPQSSVVPQQAKPADSPFSIPMSQVSQSKIEEIKPLVDKAVPPEPLKIQPKPVSEKPKDETIVDLRTFQIGGR